MAKLAALSARAHDDAATSRVKWPSRALVARAFSMGVVLVSEIIALLRQPVKWAKSSRARSAMASKAFRHWHAYEMPIVVLHAGFHRRGDAACCKNRLRVGERGGSRWRVYQPLRRAIPMAASARAKPPSRSHDRCPLDDIASRPID